MTMMDTLDQTLIALLRQNARYTVADLAQKLQVSRGTVRNRRRKRLMNWARPWSGYG
jgi:DNA-binding Lrp family transcriptional regulator